MGLGEYPYIRGREYKGIVYRIDRIPALKLYKVSFSNVLIKPFTVDENDTLEETEECARESIDKYLRDKNR